MYSYRGKHSKLLLIKCTAVILLAIAQLAISANILYFFPTGNVSHKTAAWPWVLEMAKRGHNITFISPHPKTPVPHKNIVDHTAKLLQGGVSKIYHVDRFQIREDGKAWTFDYNKISAATCQSVVDAVVNDTFITSIFENRDQYDLVVVNAPAGECGHFVGHYFKAKTIIFNPCSMFPWFYDPYGVSPEAAWLPDLFAKVDAFPMSFWERVKASYQTIKWTIERYSLSPMLQNVVQPLFGKEQLPSLQQLENNVSFVFLNSHPAVDFARTLPPMFIDIGGMDTGASSNLLPQVKQYQN